MNNAATGYKTEKSCRQLTLWSSRAFFSSPVLTNPRYAEWKVMLVVKNFTAQGQGWLQDRSLWQCPYCIESFT